VTTLATPTWVGAGGTLQATGSIPNGQSRWYRVVAMDTNTVGSVRRHSAPSVEIGPFTADATNRRVALAWNAVSGAAAYRVYVRTLNAGGVDNPTYSEITPNALGTLASLSFATATGLTFTDSVAAPVCSRPFFPVGLVLAVMTQGDAGNPGTYRTFYDAILAASPANVALIGNAFCPDVIGNYFQFAAYLVLGDATLTPVYFNPKDTLAVVIGGVRSNILSGSGSTIIWGEYDPATGRRSRGCAVYGGGYGTATRPQTAGVNRITVYADAACELNDSYVEDIGKRGMVQVTGNGVLSGGSDPGSFFGSDGANAPIVLRGTELAGLNVNTNATGSVFPSTVQDLFMRQDYAGFCYSTQEGQTYNNLTIEDSEVGLFFQIAGAAVVNRWINLRVLGRTTADIDYKAVTSARRAILRDPTFGDAADDEDPLLKQSSNVVGSTLEWESLVEVEVLDSTGAPLPGATVAVISAAGATLASGITDGGGTIPGGLAVSYLVYTAQTTGAQAAALMSAHVSAGGFTKSDRRPLALQVTYAGLEILSMPFSPTGSVAYRVMLHPDNASGIAGTVVRVDVRGACGPLTLVGVADREDVGGGAGIIEM
jgi:hypothetical protein